MSFIKALLLALIPIFALAFNLNPLLGRELQYEDVCPIVHTGFGLNIQSAAPHASVCVTRMVNDTSITYFMRLPDPGYMAIGFGTEMLNTSMVVAWKNDGVVVLSQRIAPGETYKMPVEDERPPFIAKLDEKQTKIKTGGPYSIVAFTVPCNTVTASKSLIFGFSDNPPIGPRSTATIDKHTDDNRGDLKFDNPLSC